MSRADPLNGTDALRKSILSARVAGSPPDLVERARRILVAYVDAAIGQGRSARQIAGEMSSGVPALTAARVALDATEPTNDLDCKSGCAFCCILAGEDGAVITSAEARVLHTALYPIAGDPDGRDWHPRACPALDPETRTCRTYAARPVICRSYVSTDAGACEAAVGGSTEEGPGVLGPHVDYLLVQALSRAALKGSAKVSTFSLAQIAAGALAGNYLEETLATARHRPRTLDDERKRIAKHR